MFDFLLTHNHTDNPTAIGILITVLCSFLLASLIALTYQWTTSDIQRSNNLIQSMVLIAIVAAMVMQAIGDSLARGLGMLGALAIIRFRTKLDNPRNMAFVFGALANGIACGVYGFTIAFIGTLGFCISAFILNVSKLGRQEILIGQLTFQTKLNLSNEVKIDQFLQKHCRSKELASEGYLNLNRKKKQKKEMKNVDIYKERKYKLSLYKSEDADLIVNMMGQLEGLKNVSLTFGEQENNL